MIPSWKDPATQDLWTLTASEIALLPGMTDKGRLGFAVQLKFMQVHGRFPERHDEIDPSVAQGLAAQLGTTADALSAYELNGRQGQRHQRTIRVFLGFRPTTGYDLQQLDQWLYREVLPVDPQARHGRDAALDWCRAHRLEPPARDHLDRVIRSAVYRYETRQQATIHARLSTASQATAATNSTQTPTKTSTRHVSSMGKLVEKPAANAAPAYSRMLQVRTRRRPSRSVR